MPSRRRSNLPGLPAWLPKKRYGAFDMKFQLPKVRHVWAKKSQSPDILARLKASGLGAFYKGLKKYRWVRNLTIWIWRQGYLFYRGHLSVFLVRKELKHWRRLLTQSEFVAENGGEVVRLTDDVLITPTQPKVFPKSDQDCLFSPCEGYRVPAIYVATISDAYIYGGTNFILRNDEVICHDLYDFDCDYTSEELHGRNLIDAKKRRIRWLVHDDSPEYLPRAAVFVDACAVNYAHWLTEVLPRIAAFCGEKRFDAIPIVINAGLHANIMESLSLVVGTEREVITLPIGRAIRVDELYVTSVAGYVPFERRNKNHPDHSHGMFSPVALERMRDRILASAALPEARDWPKKIFIRRNSGIRRVTNARELEAKFAAAGYAIVEPERLSFVEQVHIFSGADEIVAPTGAALANAVFSRPNTRVGVLMSKHKDMIYRYWLNMLSPLKIDVNYVLGDVAKNHGTGIHGDFHVNSDDVVSLMNCKAND